MNSEIHIVPTPEHESIEIELFASAVYSKYGYDFRDYAQASFKRRLLKACIKMNCKDTSDLLQRTIGDPNFFASLLNQLTVNVTESFRDPLVYKKLREEVLPYFKSYPEIKIWCAGCATGQEAYSLAILLMEENLYDRALIYGTDINPSQLKRARDGILSLDTVKEATKNYYAAGGKLDFSQYYTAKYNAAILNPRLKKNIIFADHNLVTDQGFGEMQLILCRNVLIYFNRPLQEKVLGLFKGSLGARGFLCLGSKESLTFSEHRPDFEDFSKSERIYRRRT